MKNRFGIFLVLLVSATLIVCISCDKEEATGNDSIIGRWEWFKTIDSWTGNIRTPETEGYTTAFTFMKNDSVLLYENEMLTNTYPYELVYRKNDPLNPNSDSTLVLVINSTERFFSIYNDTLFTDQSYFDGPRDFYKRQK